MFYHGESVCNIKILVLLTKIIQYNDGKNNIKFIEDFHSHICRKVHPLLIRSRLHLSHLYLHTQPRSSGLYIMTSEYLLKTKKICHDTFSLQCNNIIWKKMKRLEYWVAKCNRRHTAPQQLMHLNKSLKTSTAVSYRRSRCRSCVWGHAIWRDMREEERRGI